MPTPQALDSLKALLNSGSMANADNSRSALRAKQLPGSSPAFRHLMGLEDAADAETSAQDPLANKYRQVGAGQAAAQVDADPQIHAMREQELADKIKLAQAPAEAAGKYNVQAAQAAGKERLAAQAAQQQQLDARQARTQAQITQRQAATQQATGNRQRATMLSTGKAHAARPANEGILSRFLTGPSQSSLDQAEIARLQAGQSGQAGPADQADDFSNPQVGDIAYDQEGREAQFDGVGWAPTGR